MELRESLSSSMLLIPAFVATLVAQFDLACATSASLNEISSRAFTCRAGKCLRASFGTSLETCRMTCPESPPVWPKPKSLLVAYKDSSQFRKRHVLLKTFGPNATRGDLEAMANLFVGSFPEGDVRLVDDDVVFIRLNLHVRSGERKLALSTDESYELYVQRLEDHVLVNVYAESVFGARHGLETLSQLVWFDPHLNHSRILHDVHVKDAPSFPHRGVMVDTARNFFPVADLARVVDAMSYAKLNALHLHLTDATSFPVILPSYPEFAEEGAYSAKMTYSAHQVRTLVEYARVRGVKVILEVDAPSHVNRGWPRELLTCEESDFFDALLDPDNPETLAVLQGIYEDLLALGSDAEVFHVGGDEVNLECWSKTRASKPFGDLHSFWLNFTGLMMERLLAANGGVMPRHVVLWSSPLTDNHAERLPFKENVVVQYWFGRYRNLLDAGVKVIFSTVGKWYLDCGFGAWKMNQEEGVCDPYTPWQKAYEYRPWSELSNSSGVLGGEACLWSEQVSVDDLDTRLWPRAAAVAERLWTDPEVFDEPEVFARLGVYSEVLRRRGVRVAAFWPMYCSMEPEICYR
ncbi:probable beta-hexosaminidase fdl [Cylas formicarius]|uniref:probable beta-hexosaminidase fdl n=1 Tax=Cylas formicarius TaxID=197179 RepID=UPI00295869C6|nr:probable beta-hexosaminidase fdl [Cylas formicarius]